MKEKKYEEILGRDIIVSDVVNRKLNETYNTIKYIEKQNNKKNSHLKFWGGLKIAVTAAVFGVVILVGAGTVAASNDVWRSAVEKIFGNSTKKSTKAENTKNESIPEITYINADKKLAEKYLAGYIQTEKIEKNIGDYKLTLESYVTDGNIVDASMILESKKELSGIMKGNDKENADKGMSYAQNTPFTFEINGNKGKVSEKMYIDTKRSTNHKYYITYYGIFEKAQETLSLKICKYKDGWNSTDNADIVEDTVKLPLRKIVPHSSIVENGRTIVEYSPISIKYNVNDSVNKNTDVEVDATDMTIVYKDGSKYQVFDRYKDIWNTSYSFGWYDKKQDIEINCEGFNRIADVDNIKKIIINGKTYDVE